MAAILTADQIISVVNALPAQGRIMLRILLLQYLDVTQEDIDYLVTDRPDPRFQSGSQPKGQPIPREAIEDVTNRLAHYRTQARQKRERYWLQLECLRKQIVTGESLVSLSEQLLTGRFGLEKSAVEELNKQARVAIPKPMIRELDRQWEHEETTEEEYRIARLSIEYQTELRKLERERKRRQLATRESEGTGCAPLQDHEVGHIWGIPASTLTGRKVKYLHQYLQALQGLVQRASDRIGAQGSTAAPDLWKETFVALASMPVERSVATYDSLERTEAALLEKLTTLASRTLPEEVELRFWPAVAQSLFALQRLHTIQSDMDTSPEALEQGLLSRASPAPKIQESEAGQEPKEGEAQISDMAEHVLKSFIGEDRS